MTPTIEALAVTKRFGRTLALDGMDLTAQPGQVVALLGPNGAGKTTFVRMLATLLRPDHGTVRVAGYDVRREPQRVRAIIGLAGQYAAVEPAMTGRENLEMVARLFGHGRRSAGAAADRVIETFGLSWAGDRPVRTYSGGMRRRLDLAASMVGEPRLLLLDEPTTGLDPKSRNELWDTIRQLVEHGTDVLLTTQYLDEADHLGSHIVIVDRGRVVAEGTPRELKRRVGRNVVEVHARRGEELAGIAGALAALDGAEPRIDEATRRVSVPVQTGTDPLRAALNSLDALEAGIDDISLRQPTLDEVFLTLTGYPATDGDHLGGDHLG